VHDVMRARTKDVDCATFHFGAERDALYPYR